MSDNWSLKEAGPLSTYEQKLREDFDSNPTEVLKHIEELIRDESEITVNVYMEVLYFVNFLMTQISKLSDSNSDHAATNFEIEELVFELLPDVFDLIVDNPLLHSPESVERLVESASNFEDWFEEIIVGVAEICEIPEHFYSWFYERTIAPFSHDSDLWNSSRTGRSGLAATTSISPSLWIKLSECDDWTIHWRLGRNPNSPSSLLYSLTQVESDMKDVIRAGIALNPSSNSEVLLWLITNTNDDLRGLAIRNSNCTNEMKSIAKDLGISSKPFKNWGIGLKWF